MCEVQGKELGSRERPRVIGMCEDWATGALVS
jgi:hypothetical protein